MLHQITTVIASPERSEKADTEVEKTYFSPPNPRKDPSKELKLYYYDNHLSVKLRRFETRSI